jgi:hypothetical protein
MGVKKNWSLPRIQENYCLRGSQEKLLFTWESKESGVNLGFQRSWALYGSQEKLKFTWESREAVGFYLGVKRSWSLPGSQEKMKFIWESREAGVYPCFKGTWGSPGCQEKLAFTRASREPEVYLRVKRSWILPVNQEKLKFTWESTPGKSVQPRLNLRPTTPGWFSPSNLGNDLAFEALENVYKGKSPSLRFIPYGKTKFSFRTSSQRW